jgi:SAM-dependent methyltransferase
MNTEEEFSRIISQNIWGSPETPCGPGSTVEACQPILKVLPLWLAKYGVKSIVDLGCGDWNWMRYLNLVGIQYDGFDVVGTLIDGNRKYETSTARFHHADILKVEIPAVDLVICKDVLGHLPNDLVLEVLAKIKRSARLLAATTSVVWPSSKRIGMSVGAFAPIDLEGEPFSMGIPVSQVLVPNTAGNPMKLFAIWEFT